jgi:hypothetical protein
MCQALEPAFFLLPVDESTAVASKCPGTAVYYNRSKGGGEMGGIERYKMRAVVKANPVSILSILSLLKA